MTDESEVPEMAINQTSLTKLFDFYDKQMFGSDTDVMFLGYALNKHYK